MEQTAGVVSDREQGFERFRQRAGFFLAPFVFILLCFIPIPGLAPNAHHLLAVLGLVVTLWISEALPLPVTALLGPTLCVVTGIGPAREIFRSFADPIILLYLGGFLLAEAMLAHGLNRRIAVGILSLPAIGKSPRRLLVAFGAITGLISMWVSNTATTAMMYPIALALLAEMARRQSERLGRTVALTEFRYGTALMLITAFAASLGGLGTPVGTPPNLVGIGQIEKSLGVHIGFFDWVLFGLPLAVLLIAFLSFHLGRWCPMESGLMDGGAAWLRQERERLGEMTRGERNVLIAFLVTVFLWIAPGLLALTLGSDHSWSKMLNVRLPESVAALVGAVLLFTLPVDFRQHRFTLTWREATRIDWGTILLFGGGLALGDLMFSTGLAKWIGEGLAHALEAKTTFGLVALFTGVAIILSETTSNLASATMVVPVAIAVAQAAGVNPLQPALAACLGASMGFMLPVSTPPNAIVYGSGCIPLMKMVRHGALLDLAGFVAVVAVVMVLVPLVFR